MADITIKNLEDMDSLGPTFIRARAELGVTSFGMQVENLPANFTDYPEHDHVNLPYEQEQEQEEVYTALEGSATLIAGGEEYELKPGIFARVGPAERRKIVTGDEPARILALGARPGTIYEPAPHTEIGATPPAMPSRESGASS